MTVASPAAVPVPAAAAAVTGPAGTPEAETVRLSFRFNPPGTIGRGPKQVTIDFAKQGQELLFRHSLAHKLEPWGTPSPAPSRKITPAMAAKDPAIGAAVDALNGAVTELVPIVTSQYADQKPPAGNKDFGVADNSFLVTWSGPGTPSRTLWGHLDRQDRLTPELFELATELREFGQVAWDKGFHRFG